jgi:hypothetical protein
VLEPLDADIAQATRVAVVGVLPLAADADAAGIAVKLSFPILRPQSTGGAVILPKGDITCPTTISDVLLGGTPSAYHALGIESIDLVIAHLVVVAQTTPKPALAARGDDIALSPVVWAWCMGFFRGRRRCVAAATSAAAKRGERFLDPLGFLLGAQVREMLNLTNGFL